MGVWPPSKCGLNPRVRAYCPFWPRPAVLPRPEPRPRPSRVFARVAPAGLASLLKVSATVHLLDAHEVEHLLDGAAERRGVAHDDAAAGPLQPQAPDRRAHPVLLPDRASDLRHAKLRLHRV